MFNDPDLVPFEPPPKPLGLRGLPVIWRNYIESIPRGAYEEGIVRIPHRGADTLIVCEPDIIGEVLVEKAENFQRDEVTIRAFAPTIGRNSLFLAEGAEWRWQRRAVAPIFRPEALVSFLPIFTAIAERQAELWRAVPRGTEVDAAAAMTRTTFDIIVETMLGGSANLDADRYSEALTRSFATIPWHIVYAQFGLPEWMPYPHRRRAKRARDFLHREIRHTVEARRGTNAAPPDLLDLLLKARDPESGRSMTDEEVTKNLITFITAGHETTSVALTWTLWLLAKDQATQQRLFDEVVSVVGQGTGNRAVGPEAIDKLNFCRQVLQEAMRLFPPAPAISRFAKTAMTLGAKSCRRPWLSAPARGSISRSMRFTAIRGCGRTRMPSIPTASRRNLPRPIRAMPIMPFGGGARICIGAGFAMIEAVAILATLVRALRFHPVAGQSPKPVARVTLRPKGGMPLLVEPR